MGYEQEPELPVPTPADQPEQSTEKKADANAEKPKEKKDEKSFAYQCGEAGGQTFLPHFLNQAATGITEVAFEALGLPPGVGTAFATLVTNPLVTPAVTPVVSKLVGAGVEHGVAALAGKAK